MVIGAETDPLKEFRDIEKKFGKKVTWIEMDEEEYRTKRRKKDAFLRRVLSGKRISLVGRV
jgi:hypothetical protein